MRYAKNLPAQMPPGSAEYAAQMHGRLTVEITRSEALASAIAAIVRQLVGDKSTVDTFQAALAEWLTGDSRSQLAKLKEQSEIPDEDHPSLPDRLVYLTENRNRLQETVDAMEQRLADFIEAAEGNPATKVMIPVMEFQVDAYRRQLKGLEDDISECQAEMEADSTSIAVGDAPQTQSVDELGEC